MTTEEMLQLLLGKFTGLENEVKEMRSGIKSLNDKVDASHTHIIKESMYLYLGLTTATFVCVLITGYLFLYNAILVLLFWPCRCCN